MKVCFWANNNLVFGFTIQVTIFSFILWTKWQKDWIMVLQVTDLEKAFDTIVSNILFDKVHKADFSSDRFEWFQYTVEENFCC